MFRQIDLVACHKRNPRALADMAKAFRIDCAGNADTFRRVYGWRQEAIDRALSAAPAA